MNVCKYFPVASDRMGIIWTLSSIENAFVIEFGPSGTTHYAIESIGQLNGEDRASIFSTHINEQDIAFGDYKRLEKAIYEVDTNNKPKYIFVMASSISSIIGTDIESICMELQSDVNAKLIPITTGGLKFDYNKGIEDTLMILAKNVIKKSEEKDDTYNIIGCNIDQYNFLSDCEEIKRIMKEVFNKKINVTFTSYTSIEDIEEAGRSSLNIVMRKEGLKMAEYMKENFGIPYVYGKPIGLESTIKWINNIRDVIGEEPDKSIIEEEIAYVKKCLFNFGFKMRSINNKDAAIFGDYDTVVSMKKFLEELGFNLLRGEILYNTDCEDDSLIVSGAEIDRLRFLKDNELQVLLGDGTVMDMEHNSNISIQVSNPNLHKTNICRHTPLVGFRGSVYIIEQLMK